MRPRRASASSRDDARGSGAWRVVLFNVSGVIGTVLFYWFHAAMLAHYPFEARKTTVCWFVSYAASIVWQHALHRFIVFGTAAPYWRSLGRTYVCYSASLVLSSVANDVLVVVLGLGVQLGWVLSLVITGVLNYFTVSGFAMT
jgi:hypothetical protein